MKNKGLIYLSKVLIWLPTAMIIVWIDPKLIENVGWTKSYLPLLITIGGAVAYDLRGIIKCWWQRWISVLILLTVIYLQILRASNWFEAGLVLMWLAYLTKNRLVRILKARQNESFQTKSQPPNPKAGL